MSRPLQAFAEVYSVILYPLNKLLLLCPLATNPHNLSLSRNVLLRGTLEICCSSTHVCSVSGFPDQRRTWTFFQHNWRVKYCNGVSFFKEEHLRGCVALHQRRRERDGDEFWRLLFGDHSESGQEKNSRHREGSGWVMALRWRVWCKSKALTFLRNCAQSAEASQIKLSWSQSQKCVMEWTGEYEFTVRSDTSEVCVFALQGLKKQFIKQPLTPDQC